MAEHALGDRPYPERPGFRAADTSRDAALAAAPDARNLRERVLVALGEAGDAGLTADQCALAVGRDRLSVRPRVAELARLGRIVETGERRKNESGLSAKVWRAA